MQECKLGKKFNFKFVAGEIFFGGVHQEKKNISTEACTKKNKMLC